MTNKMKSFACFVTGIAMMTIVVPVASIRYVLAQPGPLVNHHCKKTPVSTVIEPPTLDCVRSTGTCPSYRYIYPNYTGVCVPNPAEYTSCYYETLAMWVRYPVEYKSRGIMGNTLGLVGAGVGSLLCYWLVAGPATIPATVVGGVTVPQVVVPAGAIAVACGIGAYVITGSLLSKCDFGFCQVNYSVPPSVGSDFSRCL